jgi:hypothetical protein
MIFRLAIALATSSLLATAQTPAEPAASVKPSVEKVSETQYRIDKVTFDQKSREIRFPAKINMTEGLLEFVIVHETGKIHESLLTTEASPTHVNLAFTLLRYPASRELYPLPSDTGGASDVFPDVPADVKTGARIAIDVEWNDNGKTRRIPVNDWIQHIVKTTSMPSGPWVYGGSEFHNGKFAPELSGDLVAIFITNSALINYPGDDNRDDTVWQPYHKRVPPAGTDVTVILSPFSKTPTASKP